MNSSLLTLLSRDGWLFELYTVEPSEPAPLLEALSVSKPTCYRWVNPQQLAQCMELVIFLRGKEDRRSIWVPVSLNSWTVTFMTPAPHYDPKGRSVQDEGRIRAEGGILEYQLKFWLQISVFL